MRALVRFIFPRQIQRLGYLWRIFLTNAGAGVTLALAPSSDFGYAALGVVGIFVYQVFFVALPRLRDAGMSVWWVLLGLIPFLYLFLTIILLFRPPEFHFGDVSNDRTVNA